MKQDADSKTADLIAAIEKGGSYIVDASGVPVRDDAASTNHNKEHTVADAAPGAPAESKAAGGGVPPASAEASAKAAKH